MIIIESIKEMIFALCVLSVVCALLEVFIPCSSVKKYTKFIFAILILKQVLQPLLDARFEWIRGLP